MLRERLREKARTVQLVRLQSPNGLRLLRVDVKTKLLTTFMTTLENRSQCALIAVGCSLILLAGNTDSQAEDSALTNWLTARLAFKAAATEIADGQTDRAKSKLANASAKLPPPYNGMATNFTARLVAAVSDEATRRSALTELCAALGDYDAALRVQAKGADTEELQDDPAYAWRLFEAGRIADALKEYQRRLADEMVDTFRSHFQEQIQLVQQRAANLTNADFSLRLVQQHYLRGFEEKADLFGALGELYRVLPHARSSGESASVMESMIRLLGELGDTAGRTAWENRLLNELKSEPEACAKVYLERGMRAYAARDYEPALALFGRIVTEFVQTGAYGDAQYSIGLCLQEQGKFDEAIKEYARIFPSTVNDYALDPEKSDDCKNYRHRSAMRTSECYEAKKDYAEALSWTEQARGRYIYVSYCKNCIQENRDYVARRIESLKAMAAAQSSDTNKSAP